ncbi:CaiB/BaiF CoA transferase family protein [Halioxenophilus aromaticivorans]|uniref:CoA transferase n=1 Tax=Halioxenophilus aromaticivorans TaxID=1306992 RepID=A0AAV3U3I3_9ALTE
MFNLLEGIKVLDLTTVVLGPYATQFLGDFGAEVVKVENLDGDAFRAVRPGHSVDMGAGFLNCNRNKRSIAVNLKTSEGKSILRKLVADSDLVIHNMRGKSAKALGVAFEDLTQIKPDIVLCHAPGFSQAGPNADQPAYDDIIQAASGIAALNADASGQPRFLPTILCDKVGGLHLALAALGAMAYKLRTGKGCEIEAPMFESSVAFLMAEQLAGQSFIPPLGGTGYDRLLSPNRKPFATADGYISLLPYNTRHWQAFFNLVGEDELAQEPWVTDPVQRSQNIDRLYQVVAQAMPARTSAQWQQLLTERDIPCTPVNTVDDLLENPHLTATEFFYETNHPTEGRLRATRSPFQAKGVTQSPDLPAPKTGQNSRAILQELQVSDIEIDAMISAGIVKASV